MVAGTPWVVPRCACSGCCDGERMTDDPLAELLAAAEPTGRGRARVADRSPLGRGPTARRATGRPGHRRGRARGPVRARRDERLARRHPGGIVRRGPGSPHGRPRPCRLGRRPGSGRRPRGARGPRVAAAPGRSCRPPSTPSRRLRRGGTATRAATSCRSASPAPTARRRRRTSPWPPSRPPGCGPA